MRDADFEAILIRKTTAVSHKSFLPATGTPCPVTSTITAGETVFVTTTSTTTTFTTEENEVQITPERITTTTAVTTAVATSTLRLAPAAQKVRRTNPRPSTSTCPKTYSAFTAACECLGIEPSTTTLRPSTVYTTITTRQTVQETSFTTITSTSTQDTTYGDASRFYSYRHEHYVYYSNYPPTSCSRLLLPHALASAQASQSSLQPDGRMIFQPNSAGIFSMTDGDTESLCALHRQTGHRRAVAPPPEEYPNDSIRFMRSVDIQSVLSPRSI
ncbi:hypothetical protein CERZMDRAFT_85524 [Cercospora zeae-maydis SCOH1-5]|uniref:Uncharacterized protein n=1 Tax=Cercospora zeae-maydis SCOH1-5 TaxID=717836 RepID=A0A6A6FD62_9PEZI|nr:hypothetical protein CERZMDRAFT_85524 [Cercospora zeae-maydis SCOH1-5]